MKYLLSFLPLLPVLALGGEYTVAPSPFEVTVSVEGVFLPEKVHPFTVDPKAWTDFKILDVKKQGEAVKKDEAVLTLDTKAIARQIADSASTAKLRKMALATAELELANLETSTAWMLATAELKFQRTKEDLAYFKEIARPLAKESAEKLLDHAERLLEYQEEELKQLLKMYAEDDLTEETEEIILKRLKNSVASAKFSLKKAQITSKKTIETDLPRSAVDLEQAFKDAELTWNSSMATLPRALEQKRLEVKVSRTADIRADEKEADLLADRKLMEMVSPVDGRLYYGEIGKGRWSPGNSVKFMMPGGAIPARTVFATVVPDGGSLLLSAFVGEEVIGHLKEGQKGYLTPAAAPRRRIAVTLSEVDPYPGVDGKFHVVLKPVLVPKNLHLVAGMKGSTKVQTYRAENALAVPNKALLEEADGSFTVQIKLADGKSEKRSVTTGAEANGQVEILHGLEAGQVVLLADGEKQ